MKIIAYICLNIRKFTVIICAILMTAALSVFLSGCAGPQHNKTLSSFVLLKEFDDTIIDNSTIDTFMSDYYKDSEISFEKNQPKEEYKGIIASFSVKNKNLDLSVVHNDDSGLCLEYQTLEMAKESYKNDFLPIYSVVDGMQVLCVRIDRFIFLNGADLWKPLFDKIGIELEKTEFSVADLNGVTYEKQENVDLDELKNKLIKQNYSICEFSTYFSIISESGNETYTVYPADLYDFKKNRKDLNSYWFRDDVPGIMTCCGLTVYAYGSFFVISRGDSWIKLLNQL